MIHPPAALILVGHGSARHPDSARPILDLAEAIRGRDAFSEVAACFMKQEPRLEHALETTRALRVAVVPVFAGKGYYTDTLIPEAMGLEGAVTRLGRRVVHMSPPVGTHPRIPAILSARARKVAMAGGIDPKGACLLLVAHGSSRPGGAGGTPRAIRQAILELGGFAQVELVFLEQEPRAADWRSLVARPEMVVMPLLVAQGTHASRDLPPLFGFVEGRRALLATGLGAEPELADIVVEMAEQALAEQATLAGHPPPRSG